MRKGSILSNQKLTKMLSFPWKVEATILIRFSLCSWYCTSQTDPVTLNPLLFHSFKHVSISAWLRAHICTAAPNSASSSTMACLTSNHSRLINSRYHLWNKETNINIYWTHCSAQSELNNTTKYIVLKWIDKRQFWKDKRLPYASCSSCH